MVKEQFEGKLLGELVDDSTKILGRFMDGYDPKAAELGSDFEIDECGEKTVVTSYRSGFILIINNSTEKVEAVFNVYEIRNVYINKERGLVSAVGHETVHYYWLDNGEYDSEHTR